MDKRTALGKKFDGLDTTEKQLFLLEGIYDRLGTVPIIESRLNRSNNILKLIAQTQINLMKLQNKDRVWTDSYIKELQSKVNYL